MQNSIIIAILLASSVVLIGCAEDGTLSVELKTASIRRRGQTIDIPLVYETYHYVETFIGDPGKRFRSLFVINGELSLVLTSDSMHVDRIYNPADSRVSTIPHPNDREQSRVGTKYLDQLTISSYGQQKMVPFFFYGFNKMEEWQQFLGHGYDAALSLEPSLSIFKSNGLIRERQFSVSFNGLNQPGNILFGAINSSLYEGQLNFHRGRNMILALTVNQIMLGSQVLSIGSGIGFELGCSDLQGPQQEIEQIYRFLGVNMINGLPILPSDTIIDHLPKLTFVIDGVRYSYPPRLYVKRAGNILYLGIKTMLLNQDPLCKWLFGTDFMSLYYTAFDYDTRTIGIAPMRR